MSDKYLFQTLNEAQKLLVQLLNEVKAEESTLAGGVKLGTGGNALQGLLETKAKLGNPTDNLIKLTPKLFNNIGIELTEIYKQQMKKLFDFYYMTLTVSLQPKRGAQFRRIECALNFEPKGPDEPIIQSIFPTSEWKELLSWGGEIDLALTGSLEWGAELAMADLPFIKNLPAKIKANIANKNKLKAFITVPEYSFKLGRVEITATGEGNSECFWRIESMDLKKTQTVQLGIVFKVPKNTTSIELTGKLIAEPSYKWLIANLRDVFEYLSDGLKYLLCLQDEKRTNKERLFIGDHEKWNIELPG